MISAPTATPTARRLAGRAAPLIDIVVPVYNEQATLERSIRRLHRFLEVNMPFAWRIVIADNASTDETPARASQTPSAASRRSRHRRPARCWATCVTKPGSSTPSC